MVTSGNTADKHYNTSEKTGLDIVGQTTVSTTL